MLIRDAEISERAGAPRLDLRIRDGRIHALDVRLEPAPGEPVVAGRGGALLPGLHDHHIHLLSLAAALASVACGPPQVHSPAELERALAGAARRDPSSGGWIRGVGYHESVAGHLDADGLARLAPDRPVRLQHRSGALWIVNRRGLSQLGIPDRLPADAPPGAECDAEGRPTGRFYRADDWLRQRVGGATLPDLQGVGALLSRFGVTGVTDATPANDAVELDVLSRAVASGALRQSLQLMGRPSLPVPAQPGVSLGAVKLVLDEAQLLDLDRTRDAVREAHAHGRAVAIHCVTRAELVLALAALEVAGSRPGDRVEHASVAPPELAQRLARLGVAVVTQPNFVRERGDAYRRDVDPDDQPWLYRCRGLLEAGVALGGGTDAPFGNPDPWQAMQAAVDRRTVSGAQLGASEAVAPERALALFQGAPDAPGGPPRRLEVGAPADLCLLDRPWRRARDILEAEAVRATWSGGRLTWERDGSRVPPPGPAAAPSTARARPRSDSAR